MQKNCSLINFENLREYITRRDQIFGKQQAYKWLVLVLNTRLFEQCTGFYQWTFPIQVRDTAILSVLTHQKITCLKNGNWRIWQTGIQFGWVVSTHYRVVKTDEDWQELLMSNRHQLEGEILIALVYNDKYLQEIKRFTLSGVWKRIPFFILPHQIKFLSESKELFWKKLNVYDVLQTDRTFMAINSWSNKIRSMPGFSENCPDWKIVESEFSILQEIKRCGEVERLHQYFIKNIDNPFSFLDDYLRKI